MFGFHLGLIKQEFYLGGLQLLHFGQNVSLGDFDKYKNIITYKGREKNAVWRELAEKRINLYRKENLTVIVKDQSNHLLENVDISIKMKKHSFDFGTAVNSDCWDGFGDTVNSQKYKEIIKKYFNSVVIANSLKWTYWGETGRKSKALMMADWLKKNDLKLRGHVLIWPGWNNLPTDLKQKYNNKPMELKKVTLNWIKNMCTTFGDNIYEWDIINEPFDNHDLMDLLGKKVIVEWFQEAKKIVPDVKLYINDYGILAGDSLLHQDYLYNTVKYLIQNKAPIDGLGFQAHFGNDPTDIEEVLKRLDRFAGFQKEIKITEFDMESNDQQLITDYTRDFMTAVFSHPNVNGIMFWGFWEYCAWRENSVLFTGDWKLTPMGEIYEELVFQKWWTDIKGKTDKKGQFSTRGFLREYDIIIQKEKMRNRFHILY